MKTYDELAESIWTLAKVAMPRAIQLCPLPSMVRREFSIENEWADVGAYIDAPNQEGASDLPKRLHLFTGTSEAYRDSDSLQFLHYRCVTLYPQKRKREYMRSYHIFDSDEGVVIDPELTKLPAGDRKKIGSVAWRQLTSSEPAYEFSERDAEQFIARATNFTVQLGLGREL